MQCDYVTVSSSCSLSSHGSILRLLFVLFLFLLFRVPRFSSRNTLAATAVFSLKVNYIVLLASGLMFGAIFHTAVPTATSLAFFGAVVAGRLLAKHF